MLYLMIGRHAKSDWDADDGVDHERPLSRRGRRSAAAMGRFLGTAGHMPHVAVSSTAVRARDTARLLLEAAAEKAGPAPELETRAALYGADVATWCHVAAEVCDRAAAEGRGDDLRAMLTSHEPTCSAVLAALTGARCRFPTGAVASVMVPDVRALRAHASGSVPGLLEAFVIPRMLA